MHNILIISSSVRTGRKSNRIASYFRNYIEEKQLATVSIADLDEYNFPLVRGAFEISFQSSG
ncbi:MAG: hypothetical protein V9E88_16130 [Ferruginibacter sp.]